MAAQFVFQFNQAGVDRMNPTKDNLLCPGFPQTSRVVHKSASNKKVYGRTGVYVRPFAVNRHSCARAAGLPAFATFDLAHFSSSASTFFSSSATRSISSKTASRT